MANPRMTAEIGRVLGGRYRLVAPIGMGASAQVYLADDVKLRRRVAVKMLHDALAGDSEFLRRFRAEARAAAALSHPNVMAVYDWSDGSDDGESAFIVTEYLPGGSLRALLDSGALLTPSQALGVGLEAARALDYAHRRGFVHRDIKPANLLFGEDQRLRIADFGLARALAEAAWTEPQGAVLGTARYASPEQAKGETLSGKADVYSLALVLVEAVTGVVPFVADTTLGTLMARVDRQLEVPDSLGALQGIITAAGRPDPDQRIDARALAKGLLRAANQLSRPAPLPLAGALAAGAMVPSDLDPTIHAPSPLADGTASATDLTADDLELDPPSWVNQTDLMATAPVFDHVDAPTEGPAVGDDVVDLTDPTVVDDEVPAFVGAAAAAAGSSLLTPEAPAGGNGDDGAVVAGTVPAIVEDPSTGPVPAVPSDAGSDEVDDETEPDGEERRRRRWPWVALIVAILLGIGGAAYAVTADQDQTPTGPPVVLPVPDLVGRTQAQATAVARAAGWKVATQHDRKDGTKKGDVIATDPDAGTRLRDGRTLTLTISDGQTMVDVPTDLAEMSLDDANAALADVGLKGSVADTPYSEDIDKGSVISVVEGTPTSLEKGSTVPLVVSNGPEPRTVPDGLAGGSEDAAVAALDALGLKSAIVRSYSDSVAKGKVISVLPKAGSSVERGSTVTVEVSRGPELIAVPDISGAASIAEAVAILKAAGLQAGSVSGPAAGSPKGTSPKAGSMVEPGSAIDIRLG